MAAQRSPSPDLRISPAETAELLNRGLAITVDVRSPDEYAAGHIPGAISAPLNRLRALMPRLPRDKTIIFY
jgi:rhodanese-related sulfurtransferase